MTRRLGTQMVGQRTGHYRRCICRPKVDLLGLERDHARAAILPKGDESFSGEGVERLVYRSATHAHRVGDGRLNQRLAEYQQPRRIASRIPSTMDGLAVVRLVSLRVPRSAKRYLGDPK